MRNRPLPSTQPVPDFDFSGTHCVLDKLDGHLLRYEFAVLDARTDTLTVLRVWTILLGA